MAEKPNISEPSYEIKKECAVLSESSTGWTKELNYISWNGYKERLDLRDWSPSRARPGKGLTLTDDEAKKLYDALSTIFAKK
ncbi:MAG: hypothetical protein LBF68_04650 [Christensenellaceae bacterium]|jgi:hypothetical protein|nr:hypothetical protein [Christensenellaceae bacterium]